MVWAAWFGMLATALNLLPFGQLDGGHITYATLGGVSTRISLVTVSAAVIMTFFSLSWLLMTVLMLVMLFVVGPRHPPVLNEYEPLGRGRRMRRRLRAGDAGSLLHAVPDRTLIGSRSVGSGLRAQAGASSSRPVELGTSSREPERLNPEP